MRRFIVLLAVLTLLIPAFAQGATKVKIGFINSITGPEAPIGENLSNGVTLALEDLKKQGIDVELIKEDDTGKHGLTVVAEEAYAPGSPDYRSTLASIKSKNPNVVFMVSYVADAILLMRQSREIGLSPQAFLGAGAGFATVQFAKEQEISNNVFSSTQWTRDVNWPGSKEFADR